MTRHLMDILQYPKKIVINALKEKRLDQKVMIYPGADEVGLSLLARAYHEYYH